jgi:LmeA-like phospholipid-binding
VVRRFLIVVLIFVIGVLVLLDRLGSYVAADLLAGKVQHAEHLAARPQVSINGFPFVTQALSGRYRDIEVVAENLTVNGVPVTTLTVHLHGVHLLLGQVVHNSVNLVPVDRVAGTAFLTFTQLDTYLSHHHPAGQVLAVRRGPNGTLLVVDRSRVHGKPVLLRGVGTPSVSGNVIGIAVTGLTETSTGTPASVRVPRISLSLTGLAFRLQLQSVSVSATGITTTGTAEDVVLDAGSSS